MCCCFCGMGTAMRYLKLACHGNGCITWFILSMVFSIIVFGILISFQVYLGKGDGQFPVENYKSFTGLLVTGNLSSMAACLTCLILIFLNKKSLFISILCEVALVFGFCVTLYSIYFLSFETPSMRISKYTRAFYKERDAAPPLMDYVQRNARVSIPIPGVGPQMLGCCGSESFIDYYDHNSSLKRAQLDPKSNLSDYLFKVPDSCCFNETKGCGKNLKYGLHFSELQFLNEAINFVSSDRNKNKKMTIVQYLRGILKNRTSTLKKIRLEAEAAINNSKLEKRFLLGSVSQLQRLVSQEQLQNLMNLDLQGLAEELQKEGQELIRYQEDRKQIKIHLIGCGRIFDAVCSSCVTTVVSIQAFVNGVTILVYIYYYVRLGTPAPTTVIIYQDAQGNNRDGSARVENRDRDSRYDHRDRSARDRDSRDDHRDRGARNDNRDRDSRYDHRDRGARDDNRDRGARDDNRDRGARDDNWDRGARDDNRDRGAREDNRDRGAREDNRDRGARDDNRDRGARDDNRDRGARDDNRERGTRGDNRDGGARDENRDPGTQDDNRDRGVHDEPPDKNSPKPNLRGRRDENE